MNPLLVALCLLVNLAVVAYLHRRFAWFEVAFDTLIVLCLLAVVCCSVTYVPPPD